jgi:myo-inositol 2-dehydrogenase / D-chiro-inositol 1-dehydrogenase
MIVTRRAGAAPPPSRRIAMGFIGLGSHGTGHNLKSFLEEPDMEPVALCDVDSTHLERAAALVRERRGAPLPASALTKDWREVIVRSDVDAVMISTPDHWHVPMALAALRAGKDVICEKPTLTIQEGQALVETVRRYGRVFQASTEDRAVPVYHRIAELVRNGRIGRLRRIHVTVPGPAWSEGPPPPPQAVFAVRPEPVPPTLDWDMWLGPAPEAPYQPERVHYRKPAEGWRMIDDYAGGILTDWGTHMVDTAQWANDTELGGPVSVAGAGDFQTGLYDTAYRFHLDYRYADGVQLVIETGGTGLRFEGADGWVAVPGWRRPLEGHPRSILGAVIGPGETHLPTDPRGEHRNFLDCVRSRRDPYFPVEKLHRLSSLLHVGNLCLKLGRPLRWDPASETFPGDAAANRLRVRALRAPWHL